MRLLEIPKFFHHQLGVPITIFVSVFDILMFILGTIMLGLSKFNSIMKISI